MERLETKRSETDNLVQFRQSHESLVPTAAQTPVYTQLLAEAKRLDALSKYPCNFDYTAYRDLELKYHGDTAVRGGIYKNNPIKLVNFHSTCQQCLYAFEIDTYGRGCTHNCVYCYAKAELTVHGYWNNPIPFPININELRKILYTVFETDRPHKWRKLFTDRVPLRVGSMSDSFMWMDSKFRVTQEFLKLMSYYNHPYIVFTRSDLIAREDYIKLLRKDLASIQFSISSTNEVLSRKIEPGAPSPVRRLKALQRLNSEGFWTTVRINPIFPIFPDGYYSDPTFPKSEDVMKFDFTSFAMVDEIADAGVPSILCGFGRFSSFSLNQVAKATGVDLRPMFKKEIQKSSRDFHFSKEEIRSYYLEFKRRAIKRAMEFTTCYIGYGEQDFWRHQDLWTNKSDCCNAKGRVETFVNDSRSISFSDRLKTSTKKGFEPINPETLHSPLGLIEF